ncbi:MAG: GIY-YIG nuclease family protein [Nitrosomonadales bacterium]|jgi:putative endonuclease|nr:GIY-YIG nuclease family protein [Nitrosomonadales bacterium]MBT4758899.1 GIY-YIG nuclease family protein [Nitrosomonadales bacterium]MBT5572907.1 GIY-YIG nuclease family protein [Nitrosomonadales bacterium]MBT6014323.1 GIY-YIG nuclease family protein [Nitrosomonadales bacterium]MBT6251125.1 GIY-YIG nuclease family protein [Nitrosomonadales bacterium]
MANYNVSGLVTLSELARLAKEEWFVYILKCADDTYYTGITKDINRRINEHGTNKGAKYTKHRGPFKLVFKASFANRSLASKQEYKIKSLSLQDKIKLIKFGV